MFNKLPPPVFFSLLALMFIVAGYELYKRSTAPSDDVAVGYAQKNYTETAYDAIQENYSVPVLNVEYVSMTIYKGHKGTYVRSTRMHVRLELGGYVKSAMGRLVKNVSGTVSCPAEENTPCSYSEHIYIR